MLTKKKKEEGDNYKMNKVTISPTLKKQYCSEVEAHSCSDVGDEFINVLLRTSTSLPALIFCRSHVKEEQLRGEIENYLSETRLSDVYNIEDLLRVKPTITNPRLLAHLYQFSDWATTQSGYCMYLWLIAKFYPDLRTQVVERFLRDDYLDIMQIGHAMRYFPQPLKNKITSHVESLGDSFLVEALLNQQQQ